MGYDACSHQQRVYISVASFTMKSHRHLLSTSAFRHAYCDMLICMSYSMLVALNPHSNAHMLSCML